MMESFAYNRKSIWHGVIWFVLLIAACKYTQSIAFAVMIPVALFFLVQRKSEQLMYVLLVSVCAMIMNSYFLPKGTVFVVCQKVLMLITAGFLAFQTFGRRHSPLVTPFLWILPYLIYMTVFSQFGWQPIVSDLKLVLFLSIYFGLYGCAVLLSGARTDMRKMRSMVLSVSAFFLFGSVLLIPFPGISMMGAEEIALNPDLTSLYKGFTNHSQALGPIVTMFGVFLFADYMFSIQKVEKLYLALILCCPILIYKTSSRTAMASYLAGLAFVGYLAMKSRFVNYRWRQKVIQVSFMLVMFGSLAVVLVPALREKVVRFVVKYDRDSRVELTMESVNSSRQHKYDLMIRNWKASPIIGNGFQVSETMEGGKYTRFKDILSAPVEKCCWLYAVLEEGGILGMALFVLFLVVVMVALLRRKAYIAAVMMFEVVMINLGEFMMFSMSALGGVLWALVFIGVAFDQKRIDQARMQQMMGGPMGMMP